ncbi:MAG TPA: aliphatic sulfonate ABC transporter substrate-binding protein [Candidatus Nitrosotalea sp.]|nr:aliphatic sulfonate ABC transporter substrate-binding protein [Candidatus Nitrosotalea sp.]
MTKKTRFKTLGAIAMLVLVSSFAGYGHQAYASDPTVLRIGYFPNITHAPAVIGIGNGDFQKTLGDIQIEPHVFNAGPAEMEALFTNQVDVAYVGPGPAINGYVKSNGDLRIISGVASGGASFVVRNDSGIQSPQDFAGKKFSSPQLGNTQDIALRIYLLNNGYKTSENGGSVTVLPASNSDIVTLMLKKDIDGAWVPEPWVTVLLHKTNSKILVDERNLWSNGKFVTANIVVRSEFLKDHPNIVKKLLEANVDEINWINNNPEQARQAFNTELEKLTTKTIPDDQLREAFSRLEFTYDPIATSLYATAEDQYKVGFLDSNPDLSGIYDLTLLNQILDEKGLQEVTSGDNAESQPNVVGAENSTVVPEFGPVAPIVFAIAVTGIVISSAKTRVISKL